MNIVLLVSAVLGVVLAAISIVGNPFLIGREREPYSASGYVWTLFVCAVLIVLSGHVFGWW